MPFDPLFFISFSPLFNIGLKGKSLLQTTGAFTKQGSIFALASEARRAPFDVNEQGEVLSNVATTTILSGALGLGFGATPILARGVKGTVNKTIGLAKGKQTKRFIDEEGNIKFSDENYTEYDKSLGDYDLTTTDFIPTPTKTVLSDRKIPQSVKELFAKVSYNSSLGINRQRKGMGEASVAQMITTHDGNAFKLINEMDELYSRDININNNTKFADTQLTADEWWEDTVTRYINQDNPDPAISLPAVNDATPNQKQAFTLIKQFFDQYDLEGRYVGLLLDDAKIKKVN